ncbi:hypothetical protein [Bacillus safensis]|uniref:hypothetical protein n=1 Tax=Bacillus safensis TaxID=561879 RepID=UPI0020C9CE9D|nr:hypothetical protein [Bacillus safensis]MCP8952557.1 hypothetical protein [Bacillus safensis]WAT79569.1 hypothetical protein O0R49_13525 [Bacillus safensis]
MYSMYPMYYHVPSPYIHNDYAPNIQRSELRKYQPSIGKMISAPAKTPYFPRETKIFIHDVRFEYVSSIGEWVEFIYVVYPVQRATGACSIDGRWFSIRELEDTSLT